METKSEYKMTEIGEIPGDWEDTNFLNVFKPIPTKKYQIPNKDILDSGCYEVVDQGKNGIAGYSNQTEKLFEDVPAIIYGDHTTIVKYRKKPFVLGADGTKLLKVKEHYNAEYCYYLLNHFNISPEGYKRHYSIVKEVKFPLTKNIKEQQKIAEILSTVDEQIAQTNQLIEKTKELKKGLMQKLLTKGINHTEFKNSELGEIPRSWFVKGLKEISDEDDRYSFTGGPFGSNLTSKEYETTGVRIIQLQNIGEGYFNNSHKIFTSNTKADELSSCNIFPGEIVMAKMAEPVARACIVPTGEERYLMSSDAIRLKVDSKRYDTKYIMYSINHDYFRKQAVLNSTGTTRLRIGLTQLAKLNILCPPLAEQKEIADILSSVDEDIEGYEEEKEKYEEMKKGLMQQLLTGKTRVKVD